MRWDRRRVREERDDKRNGWSRRGRTGRESGRGREKEVIIAYLVDLVTDIFLDQSAHCLFSNAIEESTE